MSGYDANGGMYALPRFVSQIRHAGELTLAAPLDGDLLDNSDSAPQTPTLHGVGAGLSGDRSKFGTQSLSCGSSHSGFASFSSIDIGAGDFTIEFWMDIRSFPASGNMPIFQYGTGGNFGGFALYATVVSGTSVAHVRLANNSGSSGYRAVTDGSGFVHVSLNSTDNGVTLCVGGVVASTNLDGSGGTHTPIGITGVSRVQSLYLGYNGHDTANSYSLYVNDLVVTKGAMLRTENFTPPTTEQSDI